MFSGRETGTLSTLKRSQRACTLHATLSHSLLSLSLSLSLSLRRRRCRASWRGARQRAWVHSLYVNERAIHAYLIARHRLVLTLNVCWGRKNLQVGPSLGGILFSRYGWSLARIIALPGCFSVLAAFLCLFLIAPRELEAHYGAQQVTTDGELTTQGAPNLDPPLCSHVISAQNF